MPKRNKLLTILTISIATILLGATITNMNVRAATNPIMAVSPFATGGVGFPKIGDTFSINITLAEATKIFGYQFKLSYNTTLLTATTTTTYAPFTTASFDPGYVINETGGFVFMSYYTFLSDPNGLTTTNPVTIANVEFMVKANGTTTLNLRPAPDTKLSDTLGDPIEPTVASGAFSNVKVLGKHDLSITTFTPSATTATVGDSISMNVAVKNNGNFNETFAVSTDYNGTLIQNQTNLSLDVGASKTFTFTWNTASVNTGIYLVTAKIWVAIDDFTADNTSTQAVTINATGGGGLLSNPLLLVGIAIVIIVILAIAVYALRSRGKPK